MYNTLTLLNTQIHCSLIIKLWCFSYKYLRMGMLWCLVPDVGNSEEFILQLSTFASLELIKPLCPNATVPCCIVTNLYLFSPTGELTFPEGCAPSAYRRACHAPLGAHHATDPSWQAVLAADLAVSSVGHEGV